MVIFDQNKCNLEIPSLFCIKAVDSSTYICKTCSKLCQKCEIPCQLVSNKLEVFDLPAEFQIIWKLGRVLIAKRILFKKITVLFRGKMETTGTICNVPVDDIDIINLFPRTADSTGLVIVKLKRKLEYGGHVLFEPFMPAFLCNILYYHIIVKPENISGDLITLADTHTNRLDTQSNNEDETLNLTDLLVNQIETSEIFSQMLLHFSQKFASDTDYIFFQAIFCKT